MKLLGRTIRFPHIREKFKGFFDTGLSTRKQRKTFYLGGRTWATRCKHFDKVYERHSLAKQAILTIAGQLTAKGVFLEAAGDYPRAEEALQKCEELNRRIKMPLLIRRTGYAMAKYGSCFWEKSKTPIFDARLIPKQEDIEPVEQNNVGDINVWRQASYGREIATWRHNSEDYMNDSIIPFHWDVTSQSFPYGTSILVGLDTEFEILEKLEDNAQDYMEKQAWPYELLQLGNGEYMPTDTELEAARKKWDKRQIGENIITTMPSDLKQGGTGAHPLQALDRLLHFVKDNIIDGSMIPPISKQWSSTEASATEMMPWAYANIIAPMQQIIAFTIEDEVYRPFLEGLGFSVRVCPEMKWEAPDAHKEEESNYWALQVQSGIVPAEYAAEQQGFDMEKIKQLRDEEARRREEAMQYGKIESSQSVKQKIQPKEEE